MRGEPAAVREIPHPTRISPDLSFNESDAWFACGPPPRVSQGWKLYVPLTLLNAYELIIRVGSLTRREGLHFKYVKCVKQLRKLNAGIFGYSQIGKCLIIYLPRVRRNFVVELIELLAPYRDQCPVVPCARAFGDQLPLYYRYGAYRSGSLTLGGRGTRDDRESAQAAIPRGITDALAPYTYPVREDPAVEAFLFRFPAFQAIVQQGKCAVFRAIDTESETFKEVVLKVGHHRGQVQPDGSDGLTFLRREIAFYTTLAARGLADAAPRLIEALDTRRNVILALELVPGPNLLMRRLAGDLTTDHLEQCWRILDRVHAGGLYLGDPKLANFLATDDGRVTALDFEAAGVIGERPPTVRTFFLDPELSDPRLADRAHFLASVLFPYEEGRYSWEDRRVDLRSLLTRGAGSETESWALEALAAESGGWHL